MSSSSRRSGWPLLGTLLIAACPPPVPAVPCLHDGDCAAGQRCDPVRNFCYAPPLRPSADAATSDHQTALDHAIADHSTGDAGVDAHLDATADADRLDLAGWLHRRKLTFNNPATESLHHFPVLVRLDSTRIEYIEAADDGTDLRFVDADGLTLLPYEIELWNPNSVSLVWVAVPQIDASSTADHIWMYYGNASAPAGDEPAAVWGNGFQAVYHLGQSLADSVTGLAAVSQLTDSSPGQIGMARQFYGSPSWLHLGSDRPLLRTVSQATLSGWVKPDALPNDSFMVAVSAHDAAPTTTHTRASVDFYYSQVQMTSRAADSETTGHYTFSPVGSVVSGSWNHVVGIFDYDAWLHVVYVNGVEVAREGVTLTQHATADTNATSSSIGAEDDGSRCYFDGLIDEVRIARAARTAAWIAAEYLNQSSDAFVVFGDPLPP